MNKRTLACSIRTLKWFCSWTSWWSTLNFSQNAFSIRASDRSWEITRRCSNFLTIFSTYSVFTFKQRCIITFIIFYSTFVKIFRTLSVWTKIWKFRIGASFKSFAICIILLANRLIEPLNVWTSFWIFKCASLINWKSYW